MKKGLVLIEFHQCEKNWMIKLHMEEYLKENGYTIVTPKEIESCDVIILTICGSLNWTEQANLRQIKQVNYVKRKDCIFIVTGCVGAFPKSRSNNTCRLERKNMLSQHVPTTGFVVCS